MNNLLKDSAKLAVGTCVTLCAVTVAASVAVGNRLGKVVIAGFKGAKDAVKEELAEQKENAKAKEAVVVDDSADTAEPLDEENESA